jgi:hypothetical protein
MANTRDVCDQFTEGTSYCPDGSAITGGGFGAPASNNLPQFHCNGPGSGQSWTVKAFDPEEIGFSVFAICASLK